MTVLWGCMSRRDKAEAKRGEGTDEQHLSDVKKLIEPGSSDLNFSFSEVQQKVLC